MQCLLVKILPGTDISILDLASRVRIYDGSYLCSFFVIVKSNRRHALCIQKKHKKKVSNLRDQANERWHGGGARDRDKLGPRFTQIIVYQFDTSVLLLEVKLPPQTNMSKLRDEANEKWHGGGNRDAR